MAKTTDFSSFSLFLHHTMTTLPLADLAALEEATRSPRHIALYRIKLLEGNGVGIAARFVPLLKGALESWFEALMPEETPKNLGSDEAHREEKKDETVSTLQEEAILLLRRVLQVYVAMTRMDPTLGEELGRQGSHVLLSRLINYDPSLHSVWSEQDLDTIMEMQDLACQVASSPGAHFPLKVDPFSHVELTSRLPLSFHISPCTVEDSLGESVLIHQVTERQSAQEDVGFVMWPSAVALSQWLVSNPYVVDGKSVLELGAGCGLTGLVVATRLAPQSLVLTDVNERVLENLKQNIALNDCNDKHHHVSISAIGLDFYHQQRCSSGDSSSSSWLDVEGNVHVAVDVILAADVICQPSDAVAVAQTIFHALNSTGTAIVVSANAKHRFGVDCFQDACRHVGLQVETIHSKADMQLEQTDDEHMHMTTGYVEGMALTMFHIRHDSNNR